MESGNPRSISSYFAELEEGEVPDDTDFSLHRIVGWKLRNHQPVYNLSPGTDSQTSWRSCEEDKERKKSADGFARNKTCQINFSSYLFPQ